MLIYLHSQGILVFASVMATLGLQIILESVRSLISDVSHFIIISKVSLWKINCNHVTFHEPYKFYIGWWVQSDRRAREMGGWYNAVSDTCQACTHVVLPSFHKWDCEGICTRPLLWCDHKCYWLSCSASCKICHRLDWPSWSHYCKYSFCLISYKLWQCNCK